MPLIHIAALLLERDEMNAGVVQQLRTGLGEAASQYTALRDAVDALLSQLEKGKGDPVKVHLKLGIGSYFLGRMEQAARFLDDAKTSLGKFYHGLALNEMGRHEEALKSLDQAAKLGYAAAEVQMHRASALRGLGRTEEAIAALDSLDKYVRDSAEYCFQYACLLQAQSKKLLAIEHFEKALAADPRHPGALFQLAFHNDMEGNDEEAIALYEKSLQSPPVRVGALINLGILFEDHLRFDQAMYCYEQVLSVYPTHSRARLFFKDAAASRSVFGGGDLDGGLGRHSALLDTPVTDFELSVRSRNCLKRMNLYTLGDLTDCTEQQLLASKNFGETSLTEIKQILAMKGLRLGQSATTSTKRPHPSFNPDEYSPQEQALFNRPVSELNLSVRARKCMTRLGITTVGELIAHSGDELLECKNFGVTSLVEVRDKLTTLGLRLRGD